MRGVVMGVFALSALEAFVSNPKAPDRAGTLFDLAAGAVRRLVDPTVALIPDRTGDTTQKRILVAN